jgi:hypothetical protein
VKTKFSTPVAEVLHVEPSLYPSLAQKNLWVLVEKDFSERRFARTSYGFVASACYESVARPGLDAYISPAEFDDARFQDCAIWVVDEVG